MPFTKQPVISSDHPASMAVLRPKSLTQNMMLGYGRYIVNLTILWMDKNSKKLSNDDSPVNTNNNGFPWYEIISEELPALLVPPHKLPAFMSLRGSLAASLKDQWGPWRKQQV